MPDTLVHGDFRLGNLIVDETGLRAVLDWELVHRGDPREDLGWLCVKCWRFGSPQPVAGLGTVDQLLDGYAEVAFSIVNEDKVRLYTAAAPAKTPPTDTGGTPEDTGTTTPPVTNTTDPGTTDAAATDGLDPDGSGDKSGGCGCASGGSAGAGLLLPLLLLVRRRRG